MTKRYCPNCQKYVGTKMTNGQIVAFILLLSLFLIPGFIYLGLHTRKCPYCYTKSIKVTKNDEIIHIIDQDKNNVLTFENVAKQKEIEYVNEVLFAKPQINDPKKVIRELTIQTYEYNAKKQILLITFANHGYVITKPLKYINVDNETYQKFNEIEWNQKIEFYLMNIYNKFKIGG